MGLSASQARLLSITKQISNNELESEFLSNAKMQLANKNTIASNNYINALSKTELQYQIYNENGSKESVALTFNAINQYSSIKNQYALINNKNQVYVSEKDAMNFENSDNLHEFLKKYGLATEAPDIINDILGERTINDLPINDLAAIVACLIFNDKENSTDIELNPTMHSLLANAPEFLNNSSISPNQISTIMEFLKPFIDDTNNKCDNSNYTLPPSCNTEEELTAYQRSDYKKLMDDTFNNRTKSLRQRAIDLLYLYKQIPEGVNGNDAPTAPFDGIGYNNWQQVQNDLSGAFKNYLNSELKNISIFTVSDTDKQLTQWYTNLWHLMNGSTNSSKVTPVNDENGNVFRYTVQNDVKSDANTNNYVQITHTQASDANWLQLNLENGTVKFSQATLKNVGNDTGIKWNSFEYTNSKDILEIESESKIAKAEAEYEQAIRDIQAEDKRIDIKIKKLDTEHSALKKEHDTIKGVIQKNTERSFNAFNA